MAGAPSEADRLQKRRDALDAAKAELKRTTEIMTAPDALDLDDAVDAIDALSSALHCLIRAVEAGD